MAIAVAVDDQVRDEIRLISRTSQQISTAVDGKSRQERWNKVSPKSRHHRRAEKKSRRARLSSPSGSNARGVRRHGGE